MRLKYLFTAVFVLLFSQLAQATENANLVTASSGWNNLISTACWLLGPAYILTTLKYFWRRFRVGKEAKDTSRPSVVASFFFSGVFVFSVPFMQHAQSGRGLSFFESLFDYIPNWALPPLILFFVLLPWVVAAFVSKKVKN